MLLFGSWLVHCWCNAVVLWLAGASGRFFRGGYRCFVIIDDTGFADSLAFDWLHGLVHIDVELVAGFVAFERRLVDGVFARRLTNVSGSLLQSLLQKIVMLPVIHLGVFKFAWIGFAFLFAVGGSAHVTDLGLQGHVFVLPFHHGLLSVECRVVEGVVGE